MWKAPNLRSTVAQLVVSKKRVQEILKEIHDFSSGFNTSDLTKFWRIFVTDFIGILVNKTWRIDAERAKSALFEEV